MKGIKGRRAILMFIVVLLLMGWITNLVKVFGCDFASPYKAEVIRTVGIFIPPVGGVAGYCDLGK